MTGMNEIQVLELTHMIAGPACGQILADFGARVIKVEPPTGDVARQFGPRVGKTSALFASANRGKQSVFLDMRTAEGAKEIADIAEASDVVICNLDARMVTRAGLDAHTLRTRRPELIYLDVTAFGAGGPSGTDGIAQAAMGLMHMTGDPDGVSYRAGPSIVDVSTGIWGALAIMWALHERRTSGCGAHIETSLGDVCLYMQNPNFAMFDADPTAIRRNGNHSPVSCTPMLRASDGRIMITILHQRHWEALCEITSMTSLRDDERFQTNPDRCRNQALIEKAFDETFAQRPRRQWIDLLSGAGIPCGPERTYPEILADDSLWSRGMLQKLETATGRQLQLGLPIEIDGKRVGSPRPTPEFTNGNPPRLKAESARKFTHSETSSTSRRDGQ